MKGNMTTLNNEQKSLVEGLFAHYKKDELTRNEINSYVDVNKINRLIKIDLLAAAPAYPITIS